VNGGPKETHGVRIRRKKEGELKLGAQAHLIKRAEEAATEAEVAEEGPPVMVLTTAAATVRVAVAVAV
jgi:hypothetical protein